MDYILHIQSNSEVKIPYKLKITNIYNEEIITDIK